MDTKQQLVNALAGLGSTITEAMDVIEGFVPCGHPALTVSNALVALDADDDAALAQQLETVEGFIGGSLSATLIGALLWWMTPFSMWQAGLMAFIITLMGFLPPWFLIMAG